MSFLHSTKLSNYLLILIFVFIFCFAVYILSFAYFPEKVIPITGGMPIYQVIERNSKMVLYTDEEVSIIIPKIDRDNLVIDVARIEYSQIPAQLPLNSTFITGYNIRMYDGSDSLTSIYDNKKLQIGFGVFSNYLGTNKFVNVLRYNDNGEWVKVSLDSRLRVTTSEIGLFVLCIDK